ncbi:MAG: DUF3800 domain-containing protein [Thermoanaerobaculia bacterium]
MLVFIDESGDPGRKVGSGSSSFFVVALVVFNDHEEAEACDQRITLLRRELGWTEDSEFHFARNSDKQRCEFLRAVAPYDFFYYGIVLNKDPKRLWGPGFDHKESLYKYACRLVFENARDKLQNAIVVIDQSGNREFKTQLERYLKARMTLEDGTRLIKKLKMQRSSSNNLLQLADYIAGIINRSVGGKRARGSDYRKFVAHREIYVQVWPR